MAGVSTQSVGGITWTVDAQAGTVTASGTASKNSYFNIEISVPAGDYYFYGCPTGGSNNSFDVFPWDITTNARTKQWDGTTETVSDYNMTKKQIQIVDGHKTRITNRIRSGQTVSNLVFKPMVWDGSISDDTFEPYFEPTDSLIETKTRAYLESTVGHSSKNLLEITAATQTKNGVTFTVDKANGTISASGTATSDAQLDIQGSNKSIADGIIKNGMVYSCEGTSSNLVCAVAYYNNSNTYISEQKATTSGTIISIPSNATNYKFFIRKRPAAGSDTFVFKPMLREASISDGTFEPYVQPTDERIALYIARLDQRIYELEKASRPAEPDQGEYWISIINNSRIDFDIYISIPTEDGGYFFDQNRRTLSGNEFHNSLLCFGNDFQIGLAAGTSDPVMAISSNPGMFSSSHTASRWDKYFSVDEFLDMCDVKDGSATNFITIHLCDDGGIRNQADYEAYIGG